MTICGYNEPIANGIRLLVDGMIESMIKRHNDGVPMQTVVEEELRDLDTMNQVLKAEHEGPQQMLNSLIGINVLAKSVFESVKCVSKDAESFGRACREYAEQFIALVKLTEEEHQRKLAARGPIRSSDTIESVARWLVASQLSAAKKED